MKLEQWLKDAKITQAEFAARCDVSQGTIARLMPHEDRQPLRRPSLELALRIERETGGAVTASDFARDDRLPASQLVAVADTPAIT